MYNVVDYRLKEEKWSSISKKGSIDDMAELLEEKKSYHERIEGVNDYKLVVDIDNLFKYRQDKDVSTILNDIATYCKVDVDDISYTTNFSKEGSHHFVIPKYRMKGENQKYFWSQFKEEYGYGGSIDTTIYATSKWFRLPNQTKEKKQDTEHIIQKGQMSDFILNWIDETEEYQYEPIITIKKKKSKIVEKCENDKNDNFDEISFMIKNGCFDKRCSTGSHQKYIEIGGMFMFLTNRWQELWWNLTLRGTQNKQVEFEEQAKSIRPIGEDKEKVMNILKKIAETENLEGYIQSIKDFKKHIRLSKVPENVVVDDTTEEKTETTEEDFEFPDDDVPVYTIFDIETFISINVDIKEEDVEEDIELPYPDFNPPIYTPHGDEKQRQKQKKLYDQELKKYERKWEQEKRDIDKQNREIRNINKNRKNDYKQEKEEERERALYLKRKEYFELFHAKIITPLMYLRRGSKKVEFYSTDSFKNLHCNLNGFIQIWLRDPFMKTYEYMDFLPPPRYCPPTTLNLFEGLAGDNIQIDETFVEEKVKIFIKQFWLLCGKNDKGLEYVLNYLAHIIQKTGELPRTSIVFKSKQGVGKNVAFEMFAKKLLGERYLLVSSKMDDVLGRFPLINQKLLVILDETNGKDAFSNSDQIKSYITSETLTYEKKGVDGIQILNTGRILFFTNNDNSVKIESSDRRFSVFESSDDHRNDTKYFNALAKAYEEDWMFLFHFLKTRDISNFNATNDRVFTEIYKELQLNSTHNVAKYIVSKHSEWDRDKTHILVEEYCKDKKKVVKVSRFKSNWFYNDYKMWCKESEIKPFSEMGFIKKFMDICVKDRKNSCRFVSIPLDKIVEYVKDFDTMEEIDE
jgi:hypothetical protein